MHRAVLIFDGDCGFCTTVAAKARALLPDHVRVEPWQALPIADYGLTEADVSTAAYFIDDGGAAWRGHEAVAQALASRGGPFRLAQLLRFPPVSWLAAPGYRLIAKYRYQLPGSTDACRLPQ